MKGATVQDKLSEAVEAVEKCGGYQAAADMLGIPRTTLRDRIRRAERDGHVVGGSEPEQGTEWTEAHDTATLVVTTTQRIRTVEDALEFAEVDTAVWEPGQFTLTSHEQSQKDDEGNPRIVRLWNVKVKLQRRSPNHPERAKADVVDMLKSYAPKIKKPAGRRRKPVGEFMLEISVPDIHFGKLSDIEETGEDYNLEIANALYDKAYDHLIEQATRSYDFASVLNVPSNDIMHYSGDTYATTSGTRQDSAAVWQRTYRCARRAAVRGTLKCREVAQTHVITHTDNHAKAESFYIGDALDCYFHADDHVSVDASMSPYKFYRHGNVLLGFGHGHQAKFPELQAIMAKHRPHDFSECKCKEFHLGHLHKEMLIDGWGDLMFRRIGSLSGTDSWHMGMGYIGKKSAQAFVWSTRGLEATYYFTPSPEDYRNE